MKRFSSRFLVLSLAALLVLGIAGASLAAAPVLKMATTTSTDNTGLLDYLAPLFQKDTGIELQWIAVGTGKALEMGKNADVDVLFVHAPASEKKFVADGYGVHRRQVMFNDFVIIGVPADPAGVKGMSVRDALNTIAAKKAIFVSRGDNSGTNKKEISLWKETGMALPDREQWYVQTGQGMLATINVATERDGYTMTDRGTFIKYEANNDGNPPLVILVEGDAVLRNQYSVMAVNPVRGDHIRYDLALKFIDWVISPATQKSIGDFRLMDKQLFTPNAR
jgi:tungstate transport system substrate-binding protein